MNRHLAEFQPREHCVAKVAARGEIELPKAMCIPVLRANSSAWSTPDARSVRRSTSCKRHEIRLGVADNLGQAVEIEPVVGPFAVVDVVGHHPQRCRLSRQGGPGRESEEPAESERE